MRMSVFDRYPELVLMRTDLYLRYTQQQWLSSHEKPLDRDKLYMLLCDEGRCGLTEEQIIFARHCKETVDKALHSTLKGSSKSCKALDLDRISARVEQRLMMQSKLGKLSAVFRRVSACVPFFGRRRVTAHPKH